MRRSASDERRPQRPDARAGQLLDVPIRAGLILALVFLCYQVFAPFLVLMVWALILAVSQFPLQQLLARRFGGRQGLAATLAAVLGIVLIVVPTATPLSSVGDSVQRVIEDMQSNALQIPPPRASVEAWPIYAITNQLQPKSFAFGGAVSTPSIADLLYLRFTVLTTTGFGDAVPLLRYARGLRVLEQLVGTLFLAILIARLAGVYPPRRQDAVR